ncbi:MAG: transposase zinc-binding domain-containing protein [Chlamydiales bacterium]
MTIGFLEISIQSSQTGKTVLFEVLKKHYSTWYRNATDPIPHYVDKEFKKYLGCGILAKGFACAHCDRCNKNFFIAFSCTGRGICPSCNTRSMVETAAHLVDKASPCRLFSPGRKKATGLFFLSLILRQLRAQCVPL